MIKVITQQGNNDTDFIHFSRNGFWNDLPEKFYEKVKMAPHSKLYFRLWKIIYSFFERFAIITVPSLGQRQDTKQCISLILGPDFSQFLWYRILGYEIVPIVLDGWPSYHERIHKAIKILGIKKIFFSASDNISIFESDKLQCFWLPEAIRWDDYPEAVTLKEKKPIILNFGRKWEKHHEEIQPILKKRMINYQYEKIKGQLIFPTNSQFLNALNNALISICVPSNITHPLRSGNIETITSRYFQSMRLKNIIVGKAPKEMLELFGYNPIVEIDMQQPANQLLNILSNPKIYDSLVAKNYETVKNFHCWNNRWYELIDKLIIN
jgi:hypothetical protein